MENEEKVITPEETSTEETLLPKNKEKKGKKENAEVLKLK